MRYTKKVSMWPVGLIARYGVSSPVLDLDGVVVDFYDVASVGRLFAVDMASFAVNIEFYLQVYAKNDSIYNIKFISFKINIFIVTRNRMFQCLM